MEEEEEEVEDEDLEVDTEETEPKIRRPAAAAKPKAKQSKIDKLLSGWDETIAVKEEPVTPTKKGKHQEEEKAEDGEDYDDEDDDGSERSRFNSFNKLYRKGLLPANVAAYYEHSILLNIFYVLLYFPDDSDFCNYILAWNLRHVKESFKDKDGVRDKKNELVNAVMVKKGNKMVANTDNPKWKALTDTHWA